MPTIYLGIGSNLGNRRENIVEALKLLEEAGIPITQRSSIIETDPVGGPPQGKFLNAVIKTESSFSPKTILKKIKSIEKKMGRIKTIDNGPRPIDIDILLYDNIELNTKDLTIPHPRMLERAFVLQPLKELNPDFLLRYENNHTTQNPS
ncbi:MAG TPA: 2-amino-4-hydroxy-6-hydroxymethyldihydropteridine diphosphokinase [Candidatus Omnitrophota bacterium]|nr:2-amino-4-hydroxy-6-hydroxymethyldihydropteridine diphosphokinase [Candidatus Omnitrophota bacterium]HPN87951.1 2-amino-4-hydroxy-6-hydroxymethyldihydropteridine diphosphokinase [Candidatus Omnitrophota bacterium]